MKKKLLYINCNSKPEKLSASKTVARLFIQKFIENGTCINPVDHTKDGNYVAEYYNYRFKEFSFSRNENTYSFILEPIDI